MRDFLPDEFRFSHGLCLFLHDILVGMISSGEEAGIFTARFELRSQVDAQQFGLLDDEQVWSWLEDNGYDDVIQEVAYKMVSLAVLSDFCHFVFEALSCSRKAKLTVAYALLRKPFKENLFYFEWMLVDPVGFLEAFLLHGPQRLELHTAADETKKFAQIRSAIQRTANPSSFDAQFIYDLRYKKSAPHGFEKAWNQASHLVTTYRQFKTDPQNLNFVFLEKGRHEREWEFLYSRLPYLLNYTVEVVEALVAKFAQADTAYVDVMECRRAVGMTLWARCIATEGHDELIRQLISDLERMLPAECPHCATTLIVDDAVLQSLYESGGFSCPICGNEISLPLEEC
jgi:hypothetical protein